MGGGGWRSMGVVGGSRRWMEVVGGGEDVV